MPEVDTLQVVSHLPRLGSDVVVAPHPQLAVVVPPPAHNVAARQQRARVEATRDHRGREIAWSRTHARVRPDFTGIRMPFSATNNRRERELMLLSARSTWKGYASGAEASGPAGTKASSSRIEKSLLQCFAMVTRAWLVGDFYIRLYLLGRCSPDSPFDESDVKRWSLQF